MKQTGRKVVSHYLVGRLWSHVVYVAGWENTRSFIHTFINTYWLWNIWNYFSYILYRLIYEHQFRAMTGLMPSCVPIIDVVSTIQHLSFYLGKYSYMVNGSMTDVRLNGVELTHIAGVIKQRRKFFTLLSFYGEVNGNPCLKHARYFVYYLIIYIYRFNAFAICNVTIPI